jgi:hypothetical protein
MRLIIGTLGDPALQRFLLNGGKGLVRIARWHPLFIILTKDAQPEVGVCRISRRNRPDVIPLSRSSLKGVKTSLSLEIIFVGPVTGEAVF